MNIKKIRIAKKATQQEIAQKMHVTVATVSRWESGEFSPRTSNLAMLAKALGCTIDDLLREDGSQEAKP